MQKILVIDDESAISEVLSEALNRFGFSVDTAESGTEGIAKFEEKAFDLVITDMRMPGMDGAGVVHHIRNSRRKNTPVIGISGTPWLFKSSDFDAVLPKPFPLETLADIVRGLTEPALSQAMG
ncbi:MAG: response regulator [Desulfobacterales bacterium]